MKLPIEISKEQKTAKVDYRVRGDSMYLGVLQAGHGRSMPVRDVDKCAKAFGGDVWDAMERVQIDANGPFKSWTTSAVGIESTRGGLAFHTVVTAKLVDPDMDVYERAFMKILKAAFKLQGIAF